MTILSVSTKKGQKKKKKKKKKKIESIFAFESKEETPRKLHF